MAAEHNPRRTLGIEAREQRLSRTDGYLADEAFLCGTGLEFAPIAAFDSHALTAWKEWPITPRIIDAYFQHVRGKPLDEISADALLGSGQYRER